MIIIIIRIMTKQIYDNEGKDDKTIDEESVVGFLWKGFPGWNLLTLALDLYCEALHFGHPNNSNRMKTKRIKRKRNTKRLPRVKFADHFDQSLLCFVLTDHQIWTVTVINWGIGELSITICCLLKRNQVSHHEMKPMWGKQELSVDLRNIHFVQTLLKCSSVGRINRGRYEC